MSTSSMTFSSVCSFYLMDCRLAFDSLIRDEKISKRSVFQYRRRVIVSDKEKIQVLIIIERVPSNYMRKTSYR